MKESRIRAKVSESARRLRRIGEAAPSGSVVSITQAKAHWGRLVMRAEQGERMVITRGGKPVAVLGPTRKAKTRRTGGDLPKARRPRNEKA